MTSPVDNHVVLYWEGRGNGNKNSKTVVPVDNFAIPCLTRSAGRRILKGRFHTVFLAESQDQPGVVTMSKRTFQPNNRRRAKVHGFRARMRTRAGRAIIASRRRKGRAELSA